MNGKPPSSSGTVSTGLFARIRRAFIGAPWSREEIHDIIHQSEIALDAEEKLTDRDWDFINNLAENFDDRELSPPQNKWLNDISQKLNR